jgi:hypothetical protein
VKRLEFVLAVGSAELNDLRSGGGAEKGVGEFFACIGNVEALSTSGSSFSLGFNLFLKYPMLDKGWMFFPVAKEDLRHVNIVSSLDRAGRSAAVSAESVRSDFRRRYAGGQNRMLTPAGLELVGHCTKVWRSFIKGPSRYWLLKLKLRVGGGAVYVQ